MSATAPTKAKPCNLPKITVQKFAQDVAKQLGFTPGGDLLEAVKKLGGRIEYKDFWDLSDTDSGSILIDGVGDFKIYVSNTTSHLRDRFTIAHELGHYILHYLLLRKRGMHLEKVYATRYGNDREEWEANWFASAFLMPEDRFVAEFRENADLDHLADTFGVSRQAAEVRAKSLGLLL